MVKDKKTFISVLSLICLDVLFTLATVLLIASNTVGAGSVIFAIVVLAVSYGITAGMILYWRYHNSRLTGEDSAILNNVTLEFIQSLKSPVLITDEDGNTVWYNDMMKSKFGGECDIGYGINVSKITFGTVTLSDLQKGESIDTDLCGIHYEVIPYSVKLDNKFNVVAVFNDRTEVDELENKLKMTRPVITFIVVDNLGDLYSNVQEKNRDASNKIAAVITKTAERVHGLLKEYEHDRYVMVYDYKYLAEFCQNKFDILDEVKKETENDSDVPVTISMGTACDEEQLDHKVASAKQALELALQRGGDQSVVKYAQNIEIYGGKSKTVQKRSKIRSRVIASELALYMDKCSNVLIMGHKQADHDAVGACVGIARMAMHCGAKANIVCDLNDANYRSIISDIYTKPDYKGFFIDGASAIDMIEADTLVIAVDVNNIAVMEEPELFTNVAKTVVIDHHRKSGEYDVQPVVSYIEPSVSSTCELVSEMLEQFLPTGELLKEEADLMLAGIWLDTDRFYKNTGVRTFSAAQYLRNEGANPIQTASLFRQTVSEVMGEAKFESKVIIYLDHIAISAVESECDASDKISAAKAADKLLNIKDVVASFVLYRCGDSINISARSSGNINVSLILEKLGGGGHFDMAGAQIKNNDMKDVLRSLKEIIDEYMKDSQETARR